MSRYGADCNQPVPPGHRATGVTKGMVTKAVPPGHHAAGVGAGDAPRVELALPVRPSDPTLKQWANSLPGPVTFEGTWSSEVY